MFFYKLMHLFVISLCGLKAFQLMSIVLLSPLTLNKILPHLNIVLMMVVVSLLRITDV